MKNNGIKKRRKNSDADSSKLKDFFFVVVQENLRKLIRCKFSENCKKKNKTTLILNILFNIKIGKF